MTRTGRNSKSLIQKVHIVSHFKSKQLIIFAASFAFIGVVALFSTFAATAPNARISEGENYTSQSNTSIIADTTASGGSALEFQNASSGGCAQQKRVITANEVTSRTNSGYPAGTQVFVPDGPDPWGGCFPGPSNTGIPDGTTLSTYSGPCTITTANTTITAKTINCDLVIRAANVTIQNSKITANNISVDSGSLMFTDNEVNFGNNINGEGMKGSNFTVLRSNMYGGKRQIWCNNCTLQDSYLHDQLSDPSGVTHESAARIDQGTTYRHNTLLCNAPNFDPDAGCSANQTGYPDFAPVHDVTLDKNFYMATTGGVCSYGGASAGKPYSSDPLNATNIKSTNNVFQRGTNANDRSSIASTDKRRYTCGYYGVVSSYDSSKTGFVFSGNMWDDGLLFSQDSTYPYGGFY